MSAHSFNNRFHVLAIIVSICISKCLNKYYSMNVKCSLSLAVVLLFDERNVERWSWFLRYKYAYVWLDSTSIPLYHPVCASAIAQFYVSIWYLLCFVMWMRCSNTHTPEMCGSILSSNNREEKRARANKRELETAMNIDRATELSSTKMV